MVTRLALVALTIAAMAVSFLLAGGVAGGMGTLAAMAFVPVLAAIAVIDARSFLIPDILNGAGLALGLIHVAAGGDGAAVLEALMRGAGLAAALLALREGYRRLRGREGLGLGDVKLAGVAGVWLELSAIPLAIEVAALSALLVIGARHLAGGPKARLDGRLPFGLFLAPAIWVAWVADGLLWGGG